MKKILYLSGYSAALASMTAVVFKIHHLEFAGTIVTISLILVSIYFPVYILNKYRDAEGNSYTSNIVGALCAFLIVLSVLFKLNHWPYAGILLTVGVVLFSLVFIPLLYFRKSKLPRANNLINGTGATGLSLFVLGLLFKVQHWPLQLPILIAGAALVILIYLPMYMLSKAEPEEEKINHLQNVFFGIVIGCFLLMFTWGMLGMHLLPPEESPQTTEQVR